MTNKSIPLPPYERVPATMMPRAFEGRTPIGAGGIRRVDESRVQESRFLVVFPFVAELLAQSRPESVLDYGGGDGWFARHFLSSITEYCVTFDRDRRMTALAKRQCAGVANVVVATARGEILTGGFAAVVMNAVWMEWQTERKCQQYLREIRTALRPGGQLIASVTHPCFRDRSFSTFETEFDAQDYLKNGVPLLVTFRRGYRWHGSRHVVDTHWNLEAMSRQLKCAGFVIDELYERPDAPTGGLFAGSPWLVISAKKA